MKKKTIFYRNIPVNAEVDLCLQIEGEQHKPGDYKKPWSNGNKKEKTHASPVCEAYVSGDRKR